MSKLLVFRTLPYSIHSAPEIFYNVTWAGSNNQSFGRMLCEKQLELFSQGTVHRLGLLIRIRLIIFYDVSCKAPSLWTVL